MPKELPEEAIPWGAGENTRSTADVEETAHSLHTKCYNLGARSATPRRATPSRGKQKPVSTHHTEEETLCEREKTKLQVFSNCSKCGRPICREHRNFFCIPCLTWTGTHYLSPSFSHAYLLPLRKILSTVIDVASSLLFLKIIFYRCSCYWFIDCIIKQSSWNFTWASGEVPLLT